MTDDRSMYTNSQENQIKGLNRTPGTQYDMQHIEQRSLKKTTVIVNNSAKERGIVFYSQEMRFLDQIVQEILAGFELEQL